MLASFANARGLAAGVAGLRPQDVFATSLFTGNGSSQRITTGIDMLGKGGLLWEKPRGSNNSHQLQDSVAGITNLRATNNTQADISGSGASLLSDGYNSVPWNNTVGTVASWSFRRASKFFDIVTYTGDGTSGRVIPHGLGIKPGMIIVKRRDGATNWPVYFAALGASLKSLNLNDTGATGTLNYWNNAEPDATGFSVSSRAEVNASGALYVAYLFAHDPDTTNGIVQCGSFTVDGSGNATVNLGWLPQWLLFKRTDSTGSWFILDTTRGWATGADKYLLPNGSDVEQSSELGAPTATGFTVTGFPVGASYVFATIRAPI